MNKGVTLLELLMVVGIAAVIAVSALLFFKSTNANHIVVNELKNAGVLASGITHAFALQGDYSGLSNNVALRISGLPESMNGGGTNIRTQWANNGITIAPATRDIANDTFYIEYNSIPDKDCVDFVNKLIGKHFRSMLINGAGVNNVADIALNCSATNNIVRFEY